MVETSKKIDSQLEAVSLQAATVQSMQDGIHGVVAEQQQDMVGVKVDVERYVANAIATITSNTHASQGHGEQQGQGQRGGDGGRGQLNDPRKCEVDPLTDNMSKAAFCLWRDNLDLYLEEFPDFGMGANIFLKKVRLHPASQKVTVDAQRDFMTETKADGLRLEIIISWRAWTYIRLIVSYTVVSIGGCQSN